jgi:heme-degrading monooxygenase HmoA
MEKQLMEFDRKVEDAKIPGYIDTYTYRMDADPNIYYLAILFESKEAYLANANSPEQYERYLEMRALLDSDPEWNDGEVVSGDSAG